MIQKIDSLIRENRIQSARELIRKAYRDGLAEKSLAAFAEIARRAGLPKLALNLLSKSIYERQDATESQTMEYAASIRQLGLWSESDQLLTAFPKNPRALLFRAFAAISQWNYEASLRLLENALEFNLDPHLALVVQVNRVEALIFLRQWKEAEQLLQSISDPCQKLNHQLFLNCRELGGQIAWYRKDYSRSLEIFEKVRADLVEYTGVTSAKIQQWVLLAKLADSGKPALSNEIVPFEQMLRQDQQWETLRNFHWQLGRALASPSHLWRAYFGTPFLAFKNRVRFEEKPSRSVQVWGSAETKPWDPIRDLANQNLFGKLEHRLLLLLMSDLYQPWTVYRIYNALFVGERYIPEFSLRRVYQAIDRLKSVLESQKYMEMVSTKSGYRIRVCPGQSVLLHEQMQFADSNDLGLYLVQCYFGNSDFTSEQLAQLMAMSGRSANRFIAPLVRAGKLQSFHGGRQRFYRAR